MSAEPVEPATRAAPAEARPHFQLYRTSPLGPVRWRLLGGNNRQLGRSALDHEDVPDCLAALGNLVSSLSELSGRVDREPPNLWVWRLTHDGREVAVSSHPYDRQIRSQHAMTQFLARAAVARVDSAVMITAARRWRSVSVSPVPHRPRSR